MSLFITSRFPAAKYKMSSRGYHQIFEDDTEKHLLGGGHTFAAAIADASRNAALIEIDDMFEADLIAEQNARLTQQEAKP